jgi:hypothetical protein
MKKLTKKMREKLANRFLILYFCTMKRTLLIAPETNPKEMD